MGLRIERRKRFARTAFASVLIAGWVVSAAAAPVEINGTFTGAAGAAGTNGGPGVDGFSWGCFFAPCSPNGGPYFAQLEASGQSAASGGNGGPGQIAWAGGDGGLGFLLTSGSYLISGGTFAGGAGGHGGLGGIGGAGGQGQQALPSVGLPDNKNWVLFGGNGGNGGNGAPGGAGGNGGSGLWVTDSGGAVQVTINGGSFGGAVGGAGGDGGAGKSGGDGGLGWRGQNLASQVTGGTGGSGGPGGRGGDGGLGGSGLIVTGANAVVDVFGGLFSGGAGGAGGDGGIGVFGGYGAGGTLGGFQCSDYGNILDGGQGGLGGNPGPGTPGAAGQPGEAPPPPGTDEMGDPCAPAGWSGAGGLGGDGGFGGFGILAGFGGTVVIHSDTFLFDPLTGNLSATFSDGTELVATAVAFEGGRILWTDTSIEPPPSVPEPGSLALLGLGLAGLAAARRHRR